MTVSRLFVGNLAYRTTEIELRDLFVSLGIVIKSVRLITDKETQQPRGFGFVEVEADSAQVIDAMNGMFLGGRPITVASAMQQPEKRPERSTRNAGGPKNEQDKNWGRDRRGDRGYGEEPWREDRRRSRRS